jgi:hypothetical protein
MKACRQGHRSLPPGRKSTANRQRPFRIRPVSFMWADLRGMSRLAAASWRKHRRSARLSRPGSPAGAGGPSSGGWTAANRDFTFRNVSHTQVPLSGVAAAVVGLVTFAAVALEVGWQVIRHGTVMAHEGAHAVIGSLLFRDVSGIDTTVPLSRNVVEWLH